MIQQRMIPAKPFAVSTVPYGENITSCAAWQTVSKGEGRSERELTPAEWNALIERATEITLTQEEV